MIQVIIGGSGNQTASADKKRSKERRCKNIWRREEHKTPRQREREREREREKQKRHKCKSYSFHRIKVKHGTFL